MAKSARASVTKRNHAKLRATVFGPAVDARTERLSAKLQELASQEKPRDQECGMELDAAGRGGQESSENKNADEDMDIDGKAAQSSKRSKKSAGRIQKRSQKPRNAIAFQKHPSKAKKGGKRK